jgi:hypothetical protein
MARAQRGKGRPKPDTMNFEMAVRQVRNDPLLAPLSARTRVVRNAGDTRVPAGQWAVVTSNGSIICHPTRRDEPEAWVYVLAHCLLHLGLGHVPHLPPASTEAWNLAAEVAVQEFLDPLKLGRKPREYELDLGETRLPREFHRAYAELRDRTVPATPLGDLRFERAARYADPSDYPAALAVGIRQAVESAIARAAGAEVDQWGNIARPQSTVARARDWFVSSFPLLGALAASFELVEDRELCSRMDIRVAAVDAFEKRLYFNPLAGLSEPEARFVMAHEFLHVALRHHARVDGRDPYLWNVACDYAINLWLDEMAIGARPTLGLLLDRTLKGMSAESIYDRIVTDLRVMRRRATFRATGKGDMLDGPPEWWSRGRASSSTSSTVPRWRRG